MRPAGHLAAGGQRAGAAVADAVPGHAQQTRGCHDQGHWCTGYTLGSAGGRTGYRHGRRSSRARAMTRLTVRHEDRLSLMGPLTTAPSCWCHPLT